MTHQNKVFDLATHLQESRIEADNLLVSSDGGTIIDAIAKGGKPAPYCDFLTAPDTIVVLSQPKDQKCAVLGGLMAERIKYLGGAGVLVDGRVRDLGGLKDLGIPVSAIWPGCVHGTTGTAIVTGHREHP